MMQSGLSRQLFEAWCTDKRNGVIVAGYCVEGTLAKVSTTKTVHSLTMHVDKMYLHVYLYMCINCLLTCTHMMCTI